MFRISRLWLLMLGFVIICAAPSALAFAQDNFYRGKTIRLVVGLAPGGGFDTYSRVIARHIGKHISGNPTTIVDNMPGAASLLAANYVYKAAKPDGLTIGNFVGGLSFQQMLGLPGVEFDAPKFEFLGVPATDNFMPNDGDLLDFLLTAAPDESTRNRILVDNPAKLYGWP